MPRYLNLSHVDKLPVAWNSDPKMNFKLFQKGEKHINRTPDFSTLVLVFKGTLSFIENGERKDVKAGEYYIQEEGRRHEGVTIIDPPVYFFLHFWGHYSDEKGTSNIPISGKIDIEEIRNICTSSISGGSNKNVFDVNCCLYRILKKLQGYNTPKRGEDIAARVADYIESNPARINTLEDVCKRFNYSKDYLIRAFKKRFNITPYQYIKYQKVAFAKELLRTTNLPIAEIAENCGYSDETVFFRVFKSVADISPAAWREKLSVYIDD